MIVILPSLFPFFQAVRNEGRKKIQFSTDRVTKCSFSPAENVFFFSASLSPFCVNRERGISKATAAGQIFSLSFLKSRDHLIFFKRLSSSSKSVCRNGLLLSHFVSVCLSVRRNNWFRNTRPGPARTKTTTTKQKRRQQLGSSGVRNGAGKPKEKRRRTWKEPTAERTKQIHHCLL